MPLTRPSFWMVLLFSLLVSAPTMAGWLEMADLMAHPEHYDRKEVVVVGKVHHVEPVIDRDGHPAFRFLLEDGVGTLKVTTRTNVQEGDHVIVEGTFSRRRQAGRMTVYSEVNATSIRPLNQFTPELLG